MTCLQLLVYHRTLLTMYHHPCLIISSQPLSVMIIDDVPPPPDNQLPVSLSPPLSPSPLGLRRRNILNERKRARECLTDQAERMVKRSRIELQPASWQHRGQCCPASSYGGQGKGGLSQHPRCHHRQERKRPLHHCHKTRHPV